MHKSFYYCLTAWLAYLGVLALGRAGLGCISSFNGWHRVLECEALGSEMVAMRYETGLARLEFGEHGH